MAMTDEEYKEALTKNPFLRKANVLTNVAYILADAANSAISDCEGTLNLIETPISKDEKKMFLNAKESVRTAKARTAKVAKALYEMKDAKDVDDACYDSDWWYDFIKKVVDRVGNDKTKERWVMQMVSTMTSELQMFK